MWEEGTQEVETSCMETYRRGNWDSLFIRLGPI